LYRYKRVNDIIQRDQGGIISPKSNDVNLIINKIIQQNETDYNGWWFDHAKYHFSIKCYNSKFPKCVKVSENLQGSKCKLIFNSLQVFSTECKYDRIRAIYQYLPVKKGVYLNKINMSLRASIHHLVEEVGCLQTLFTFLFIYVAKSRYRIILMGYMLFFILTITKLKL